MIDLVGLSALRAVEQHGSVVEAAAVAGYTPSAVSQQIKRLERETGVALLERVGRNVVLTAAGRHLVSRGTAVLVELETIQAELQRASDQIAGQVRLGANSTALRGIAAPAVGQIHAECPALAVGLVESEPWDSIEMVGTGLLDMAVVHSWGKVPLVIPEHLSMVRLGTDVADVIAPSDHRISRSEPVSASDLNEESWIATPTGTICREWLERMYLGIGRSPNVAHESLEYQSHIAMVGAGLGIALIPRLGRGVLPEGVVALEVEDPVPCRTISLVHRRSAASSPITDLFIATLRSNTPRLTDA